MKIKLTKEEKEILDSFEKGEWVPVADLSKRKKELTEYARNTLRKDKRLNIRISERGLIELQRKAVKEGLPSLEDVMGADEVFLTNSSWHVLPVTGLGLTVKADTSESENETELRHHTIADGEVGNTTADLRAALLELIEQETSEAMPL